MFNRKGTTLIESLFAFEIFITVLILYTTLFVTIFKQEVKIRHFYNEILQEEGEYLYQESFIENIEMVLHS